LSNYTTLTSDKSKKTAFWLCLFGGIFGLHYFYVGRYKMGMLYCLTLGVLFLGWGSDLLKIMNGKFCDNVGAPLRQ